MDNSTSPSVSDQQDISDDDSVHEVVLDIDDREEKTEGGGMRQDYVYVPLGFLGRLEMAFFDIARAVGEVVGLVLASTALTILPPIVMLGLVRHWGYTGWPEGVALVWLIVSSFLLVWWIGRWIFYIRESLPGLNEFGRFLPSLEKDSQGRIHIPLASFLRNRFQYMRMFKKSKTKDKQHDQ